MAITIRPKRIANKIILLVLCLEITSIALWGSMTYSGSKKELLETISSRLTEAASLIASDINHFILPIDIHARVSVEELSRSFKQRPDKLSILNYFLSSQPEVEEVSLIDRRGQETIKISRMGEVGQQDLQNLAAKAVVHQALSGQAAISDVQLSDYFVPQLLVATPISGQVDDIDRVMLKRINLKGLWDKLQSYTVGSSGYTYILDEKFKLIAHPDPSLVLSGLQIKPHSVPAPLFEGRGATSLQIYTNFLGHEVAAVSRYDDLHRWWIVVEQPVSEGLAPLSRVIDRFILAFVLAVLVTIIIVVVFSRRTMRPLSALEAGIGRMAKGERRVRVDVPNNTELASLANAFNSMASSLDQQIGELLDSEQRIHASQQALQQSEQQVRLLLNSTAEPIYGIDNQGLCTFCNPAAMQQLGYHDLTTVIGKPMFQLLKHTHLDGTVYNAGDCPIHSPAVPFDATYLEDTLIKRADGKLFHAEVRSHPIIQNDEVTGRVITFTDITERHAHLTALEYQATHDDLTGLPNRKLLYQHMDKALVRYQDEKNGFFALLLIDLDRFKEINDTLGHFTGDIVLKQLGPRIMPYLAKGDTLARLGGDEFALLLRSVNSEEQAVAVMAQMVEAMESPFELDGMELQVGASVGMAFYPQHGDDTATLMRCADVAMYQAKHASEDFAIYSRYRDPNSPQRLLLMTELKRAIEEDQLELYYQPKAHLHNAQVYGVEALVRWHHPEQGFTKPDQFIPDAEMGGLIKPLSIWVLRNALKDCRRWHDMGRKISVAVNISMRSLQDNELPELVADLLSEYSIAPEYLYLEITESALMSDPIRAREIMEYLNEMGIGLSIDDFGTGYSSLAYLKELPVSDLKIDKGFVQDMEQNESNAIIVRSTIDLAHNLSLKVTAEGVEDLSNWDLLVILGCDDVQGYFLSEPLNYTDFNRWIIQWESQQTNLRNIRSNKLTVA